MDTHDQGTPPLDEQPTGFPDTGDVADVAPPAAAEGPVTDAPEQPAVPAPAVAAAPPPAPAPAAAAAPPDVAAAPAASATPEVAEAQQAPVQPAPAAHGRGSHVAVVAIAVLLSLIFGSVAGAGAAYVIWSVLPEDGSSQEISLVGESTEEVVAAVAAVATPSIVNIQVTGDSSQGGLPPGHPDALVQGEGSGVAYKEAPDGGTYIITNNHVVEGADEILVTDSTGEQYPGELVGADSETDIAVVMVDAKIPTIEIGDSEELVVGQLAVAIGSPFGLEGTVTSGIVSALHRPLTGVSGDGNEYPYVDSIQTDAAINPGNSGGALIDRDGRLIGIPSAIMTETGTSEGVGLAIPVNTAVNAADQLIEKGRVDTPFLGILGQTVDETLVKEESLPVDEGAYVAEVTPDTEAEKAGLQSGDVIVALDDMRIRTMDDLVLAVRRKAVGDTVTLTLWRDGEKIEVEMKVGVKPQDVGTG